MQELDWRLNRDLTALVAEYCRQAFQSRSRQAVLGEHGTHIHYIL